MGGTGSSKPLQPIDFTLSHPKFSNSKLVVNEKQRHMQTMIGVDNKQYDSWKSKLEKAKISPQHLLLPIKEEFSSKGLCGSSGILTLHFQDFPYLLTDQIASRLGKKKLFSQNQLWYLFYSLIAAKRDMVPSFSKIGDVRPHNIFINDKSQIKVSNLYSWPHENTNFTKVMDNEVTYLAPEQVKQLEVGGLESNNSNDVSQLFSIGLTLLSAATLEDFTNAYDLKKFTINYNKIIDKLNQFKLNRAYSDIFKGVVCNLCEFDETRRVGAQELWAWLEPHQQKILVRENFFIPSAPDKIHQEVAAVRQFVAQTLGQHHIGELVVNRQSGFSGQKLNFPPPIVRTSIPEVSNTGTHNYTYSSYTNPLFFNAESTYIPATSINQVQQTTTTTTTNANPTTTTTTTTTNPNPNPSTSTTTNPAPNNESAKKETKPN